MGIAVSIIKWLVKKQHERRIQESFRQPVVELAGRQGVFYYESGNWTEVDTEMGTRSVNQYLFDNEDLKWKNSGVLLTVSEREKVIRATIEYFERKRIKWQWARDAEKANFDWLKDRENRRVKRPDNQ